MFKKIALILALFVCTSFAQEVHSFVGYGSKAVLFEFSGLSNLGANNFDGGAGMKYFLTSQMALRGGLQVNVAGSTTPANPGTGDVGIDGSATSTTLGIEAALEYHLTTTRVTPYLGGGIGFSSTSTDYKPAVFGTAPLYQSETKNATGSGAGTTLNFFVLMGVEYFIVNEVSLGAEYRLGYDLLSPSDQEYSSNRPGSVTVTTKGTSSHSLYLSSAGFLTLAVYF
ncbi:MAG: outer membrane beta-barrel protein [Ignavibacteriaceae bacterium]|nr:outer membrane beta-barrel protein [Ignavibacteriaceae bacterium]